ncbi:MAG: S8 family serine peptidase, partial [Thermoleophilia bacterium]|nr:S8 family serine peptidase [Thermoleophilia bacterium]
MPGRSLLLGATTALLASLALAPGSVGASPARALERPLVAGADVGAAAVAGVAVRRALARRERVAVVVALRPDGLPGVRRLDQRRQRVAAVQRRVLRRLPRGSFRVTARWTVTPGFAGTVTAAGLRRLGAAPDVLRVDVDRRVRARLAESVALIRADQVQGTGVTGAGVTVAVLDTGVDRTHPDLAGDIVGEQCFAHLPDDVGGCPDGSAAQSGPGSAADDQGHGTAMAGIVTSDGVRSARGVAPAAKIVAVKVLAADGEGTTADLVSGLDWLVTNRPDVKVVNMSIGGGERYASVCDEASASTIMQASVLRALRSRGVTVFIASGNDGSATAVGEPACIDGVVSVGAVYDANVGGVNFDNCADSLTAADTIMCISNGGARLDLLAPGGATAAPALGGSIGTGYGTSNAAPHAAGVAALMLQVRPDLAPDQLVGTLKATGVSVLDQRTGRRFPRVDAAAAVAAVP